MTISELKKLDVERKKDEHPNLARNNPDAICPYAYNQKNANGLTRCIIDAINFTGGYAVRINNGGTFRKGKTIARDCGGVVRERDTFTFNGTRGVADIDAIHNGIPVKIEVKFGKDRMSEAQLKYQKNIERSGGIYIVARTLETFWTDWEIKVLQK